MRTETGRSWLAGGVLAYLASRLLRRDLDLAGKVVLISGSSRGLGLFLAEEFARQGARLILCARDEGELEAARKTIEAHGTDVMVRRCDVADLQQATELVDEATRQFGSIDILVNNAGILQVGPLSSMTLDDFRDSMNVNFWGALHLTMAVLPRMREAGEGRIVNVTSIGGKVAVPHLLPYDVAKFALVGFSEGLHAELLRDNIRVTTVVPGLMRTGSSINADFKGDTRREFGVFMAAATLPITAMDARRAARRIVRAVRRGVAEVTLSWQARLMRVAQGLAPGLTADVMGLVASALPRGDGERRRGSEILEEADPRLRERLERSNRPPRAPAAPPEKPPETPLS